MHNIVCKVRKAWSQLYSCSVSSFMLFCLVGWQGCFNSSSWIHQYKVDSKSFQATTRYWQSEFAIGRACWLNKEIGNYSKKKERGGIPGYTHFSKYCVIFLVTKGSPAKETKKKYTCHVLGWVTIFRLVILYSFVF